jgi:hypothetical protein
MRRFLILLSSVWFCASAQAAPAINSQESSHLAHHSNTSPLTWTFNNVGGTTLFVAVDLTQFQVPTFGAVTYNGVTMSVVPGSRITWGGANNQIQWYYLNNPAIGSHMVSVSAAIGGGAQDIIAAAISFTGLDPTIPYGGTPVTNFNDTGGAPSASVNVTGTTNGNYVLSAIANGDFAMTATSPTVLSAQLDVSGATAGDNFAIGQQATAGGTVTAGFSWGSNDDYGITAFEVKAAAGALQSISQVNLSNSSFAGGSPSGTVVGAISEVMSPASPAFNGTLSLSGTDASKFQIVGSNLKTNGVVPPGTYHINIVATEAGAIGSPFTQAETIVGNGTSPLVLSFLPQIACNAPAGTLVMALQTSGGDGNPITYAIAGDTTDFALSGSNVVVGNNGIAPANCGKPNAVTVTATQP